MDTEKRSWGVQKRLEFIERKLYWEGRINRSDLTEFFDISAQQASSDLSEYQTIAPNNLEYDKNAKHYRATSVFQPKLVPPDSDWYLSKLLALLVDKVAHAGWVPQLPSYDAVPSPRRMVEPDRLRSLVQALHNRQAIDILYQSFSKPEPIWRTIAPHALAFDGLRWHTRAYCYREQFFKDFTISRIFEIKNQKASEIDPQTDVAWHQHITLVIGPDPNLAVGQKKSVEYDYSMTDGKLEITTRIALAHYVIRHLRLDLDKCPMSPADRQIVLLNKEEVEAAKHKYKLPHG